MMRQELATNASDASRRREYLVPGTCRNGDEDDLDPGSDGSVASRLAEIL